MRIFWTDDDHINFEAFDTARKFYCGSRVVMNRGYINLTIPGILEKVDKIVAVLYHDEHDPEVTQEYIDEVENQLKNVILNIDFSKSILPKITTANDESEK